MVAAAMTTTPVELAPEPVYDDVTWVSAYDINPLDVPTAEKAALLVEWTERLRTGTAVDHATAFLQQVQENKFYADLAGTPDHPAAGPDCSRASRRSAPTTRPASSTRCAPSRRRSAAAGSTSPAATGTGTPSSRRSPTCSPRSSRRPASRPARYDLVVHPSNLWLTIHESIGHATELDRALGYEANYAGTSFATYDKLGTLQYGSPVMNVTGDRTVEHGLATIGYDDEGVADAVLGHRPGRRARRLPARPADGPPQAGAQRRPVQRLRVRRLPRPHPDPADGQRVAAAGRGRSLAPTT